MTRARARGFTLIEVMVALAILALGLVMLLRATAHSVRKAEASRMSSVATLLARGKMFDVEEDLRKQGFTAAGAAGLPESGTFEEQGWPQIAWKVEVRDVELPSPEQIQQMQKQKEEQAAAAVGSGTGTGNGSGTGAGTGTGSAAAGGAQTGIFGILSMFGGAPTGNDVKGAGLMGGGFYTIIQQVFKEAIRKVVLTVSWKSLGVDDSLEVVEYLTDPDAMNRVLGAIGGAGAGDYGADNAAPTQVPGGGGGGTGGGGKSGAGTGTGTGTGGRPGGLGGGK